MQAKFKSILFKITHFQVIERIVFKNLVIILE